MRRALLAADAPQDYLEAPQIVVEVPSPATEAIDRREKWLAYRRLDSLQEYVLIDQTRRWVEVYRRTPSGWAQDIYTHAETVALASLGLAPPLAELYADSGVGGSARPSPHGERGGSSLPSPLGGRG